MKQFDVKLLVPLKILAETAEDVIEKVKQDLGNYWIPEHCLDVKEAMKMNESERAIAKAELISADEEYFGARPQLVSIHNRRIFESGFRRGWDRRDAVGVSRVEEIALLKAEVSKLKLKVCALKINLDLARGEQIISVDNVCPNCDEPLPGGCGGRFSNEYDCMWRYT